MNKNINDEYIFSFQGFISLFKNRLLQLKGSSFVKDAAILSIGTASAQFISIASMPVLSRIYTPSDFGTLAVFLAVANIIAIFITLRYETSILIPKEQNESVALVGLCLCLLTFMGAISTFSAFLVPAKFKEALGLDMLGYWLPLSSIAAMGLAVIAVGTAWLNRLRSYYIMAKLRVAQTLIASALGICLGLFGFSQGLLLAQIVSVGVVAIFMLMLLLSINPIAEKAIIKQEMKRHLSAPKFLLPTALIDIFTQQLPVLLITAWFSTNSAGQFSMAWRILGLPISLVGAAVGQVFIQRFAELWPDVVASKKLMYKTWKMLGLFGLIPTIVIIFFGKELFSLILGSSWIESGRMASVIAPMLFAMLISSPTSGIFIVLGLQKYSLYFGAAFLIYRTSCLYFGLYSGNIYKGLAAWVVFELCAIYIYNLIAIRKMERR